MPSNNTQQEPGQSQYAKTSSQPKLALVSFWPILKDTLKNHNFCYILFATSELQDTEIGRKWGKTRRHGLLGGQSLEVQYHTWYRVACYLKTSEKHCSVIILHPNTSKNLSHFIWFSLVFGETRSHVSQASL